MSYPRYDIEWVLAGAVAAYLGDELSDQSLQASPVVTFFDPMAVAEENRLVVEVPRAVTDKCLKGIFDADVTVTVKSRWTQKTVQTDFQNHYSRTNDCRDKLMADPETMSAALSGYVNGVVFDYVQPKVEFSTDVREGWIYSEAKLVINGHSIETNP